MQRADRVEISKIRGRGFEPRLEAPKAPVLPLDDPRIQALTEARFRRFKLL